MLENFIWIYLFHKNSVKNRNYRETIRSSIINETISQHLINHHKDDKIFNRKDLNKKNF